MINKKLSVKTKQLKIQELLKYHKLEEILGYCSRCSNYGQFWSCPPHSFPTGDYFSKFNFATIIGIKIYLDQSVAYPVALDYFNTTKIELNEKLLEIEKNCIPSTVLIGGHCWHCKTCTRKMQNSCNFPDKKRHSLEALGIKISDLIEEQFQDKLQWSKGSTPESLYVVQAILTESEIDFKELECQLV